VLPYDPVPWLMAQEGLPAVRARRVLRLVRPGDEKAVNALRRRLSKAQQHDGSFQQSPLNTAGVLNLLDDTRTTGTEELVAAGASYLISVLESQPGYRRAGNVEPGSLRAPHDLCGFFGPYEERNRPDLLEWGAREMNFYREVEPLLGPKSVVRKTPRSARDQPGPGSCFAWGMIPLSYTLEALFRAGYGHDDRLKPAINALLGAQRDSGGWCRNLGGHPSCSIHAIRAIGAHPELKSGKHAERALEFMHATQLASNPRPARWWRGSSPFAAIQAASAFDLPVARDIIREVLIVLAPRQKKNGTFGAPCKVERVAAVLCAERVLESLPPSAAPSRARRTRTEGVQER
jgi:hypothetical protein